MFSYFLYSLTLNFQSLSLSDDILRERNRLKWIFITPYGETDSSYANLFLSQEDCTELAGTPVELSFCTIEKYLNMTASGISADVVTCWTPIPTLNDWKQPELPGLCRTCWTRKFPALSCPKTLSGGAEIFREMFTPIRIPEPFSLRIPLPSLPPLWLVARTFWKKFTGIVSSPCPKRIAWNS